MLSQELLREVRDRLDSCFPKVHEILVLLLGESRECTRTTCIGEEGRGVQDGREDQPDCYNDNVAEKNEHVQEEVQPDKRISPRHLRLRSLLLSEGPIWWEVDFPIRVSYGQEGELTSRLSKGSTL